MVFGVGFGAWTDILRSHYGRTFPINFVAFDRGAISIVYRFH